MGLDVGSTTVKAVVMDENKRVVNTTYRRHFSDTKNTVCDMLEDLILDYKDREIRISLTGSGAMDIAKFLGISFVQEVVACKKAVETYIPKTDVVIELGGEDAKIIYFGKSIEQRMNGTCAGGTGAFLDQMASLLDTDTKGLDDLAKGYKRIYPIASRCGVFAKTDIQPLLNEGVEKENIAISIFQAVVNQTISGLACGRKIRGNVAFLGGPLNYLPELRNRFKETLGLSDEQMILPDDAHLFVAKGACIYSYDQDFIDYKSLEGKIANLREFKDTSSNYLRPLFKTSGEYSEFKKRHSLTKTCKKSLDSCKGDCFLGIDAGSTTSKLVLIDENGDIIYSQYKSNEGKPLQSIMDMLEELYKNMSPNLKIRVEKPVLQKRHFRTYISIYN